MKTLQKLIALVFILAGSTITAKANTDLSTLVDSMFGSNKTHISYVKDSRYYGYNRHSVLASYYGHGERLNKHTASGQVFNPNGLTAASLIYPLGSRLLVSNGRHSVTVTVNDRGPAAYTGRSLDLSYGAAKLLGMIEKGVVSVHVIRIL